MTWYHFFRCLIGGCVKPITPKNHPITQPDPFKDHHRVEPPTTTPAATPLRSSIATNTPYDTFTDSLDDTSPRQQPAKYRDHPPLDLKWEPFGNLIWGMICLSRCKWMDINKQTGSIHTPEFKFVFWLFSAVQEFKFAIAPKNICYLLST